MSEIKDRIKKFCDRLDIAVSTFEKNCGLSNGYVNGLKKSLGKEKLDDVLKMYPNLNRDWLLWGEGEMLKSDTSEILELEKSQKLLNKVNLFCASINLSISQLESEIESSFLTKGITSEDVERILDKYPDARKYLETDFYSAAEPTNTFLARRSDNMEIHTINEGAKAIVIPFNLSRNPKCKLSELTDDVDVDRIMPKFKFLYQVQTHQLEPCVVKGDWLMLDSISTDEVINYETYLINTQRFGVMVRTFQWVDENTINLVNINNSNDILTTSVSDINDVCRIVSILRTCTSILPFAQTTMGKIMISKEAEVEKQLQYNKEMFDEVRKSGERTDMLINLLVSKLK